ncbi:related to DUF821 domain protein [Phialocephala subalpina]|uniref:Related to DUF821 domain protein n=1 Tax=Phialocephala subalpina TaxID=576137 RepID=A0A1L7XA71_9HELO|nr:related to DUF821 domain protein [Phialocephala subalpina]
MSRRRPWVFSFVVFSTFTFLLWTFLNGYHHRLEPFKEALHESLPPSKGTFDGAWNFTRDAGNLLMTDAHCDAAFPDLFKDIDRAVKSREYHHITVGELDKTPHIGGYIRGLVYDQQLYVISAGNAVNSRTFATLLAMHRAIVTSPEPLPNIEFIFVADDLAPGDALWAYSRQEEDEKVWLMPDFGYWSWPEPKIGAYNEVQMKATARDEAVPWKKKKNKLVWRGASLKAEVRAQLVNESRGYEWEDVKIFVWQDEVDGKSSDALTMDQHCEYKYVAHTEGVSYSSRLQNLQNCNSVVVSHKLKWIQHHHHLMVSSGPDQNFVETAANFSDLAPKMQHLLENDAEAERIAQNNIKTFREHYLTKAAETCYWRKLIRGWAKVSFEPEFTEKVKGKRVWRGLPVESFVLERRMDWDYH